MADANGDGLLDVATGMEGGGSAKLFFNPGPAAVGTLWPVVKLAPAISVEDALIADIDSDGRADVVTAIEGNDRSLYVFFGPGPESVCAIPISAVRWSHCTHE